MVDSGGNKLIFVSCGGELVLWEEDSSEKKYSSSKRFSVFQTNDKCTGFVCWSDDNKYIACSSCNEVVIVNVKDQTIRPGDKVRLTHKDLFDEGLNGNITCVCFTGSGNQLLVGSSDGLVRLWDVESATPLRLLEGYPAPVCCISYRAKSSLLVAGLDNGHLVLHNLSSTANTPLAILSYTEDANDGERVNKVAMSPFDYKLLASCGSNGCVRLWSTESHRLLTTFEQPHTKEALDVTFSPYNRKLMASVGGDGKILLYDIQQRKQLTQLSCHVGLCSLLLMKDGVTMVTGGMDGNLYFYYLKNCKKPEYVINGHKGTPVTAMAVQNIIKSSSGSSRKLPSSKQVKKSTSKVTFQEVNPMELQTPSPIQNTIPFTTPLPSTTPLSNTTPLNQGGGSDETSGIFSPLDAPYSTSTSHVQPMSNGQPSNTVTSSISMPSTTIDTTDRPASVASTRPTMERTEPRNSMSPNPPTLPLSSVQDNGNRPLPPLWPTAIPANIHSSSIFSPLGSATSQPVIDSNEINQKGLSGRGLRTTSSLSDSAIGSSSTSGRHVPSSATKKPSSARTRPGHPKRAASPTSVITPQTTNKSNSLSKLDSTSIVKENPTGSVMESSTLLHSHIQSHLPSPDIKSTPTSLSQPQYTDPTATHSGSMPTLLPTSIDGSFPQVPGDHPSILMAPSSDGIIPSVHMQYMENLIKDSQDRTVSTIHSDIMNLSVSMHRRFSALENLVVLGLTGISEKIDRTASEVEELKHRIDHLTPKY